MDDLSTILGTKCELSYEHWQLDVYFQHRFLELSKRIDKASHDELEAVVIESVHKALSVDYVLKPLTPKFLRLALQMIHRYNDSSPLGRLKIDDVQGKLEKLLDPEDLPIVLDMFKRVLDCCPTTSG